MQFLNGETVTILRAGTPTTDRYGNEIPGADVRVDVEGCAVAARSSSDADDQGRLGVIIGLTVFFPADTDVSATDRLEVRGEQHVIIGDPFPWHSPFTGWEPGVEVATERVEG